MSETMTASTIATQLKLARTDFTLDVDIELPGKGVSVFYGHSGSGKTTLLRCIAGLEQSAQGHISFNGHTWQDKARFVPTYQRPLGYVFQEASLFPHLTAEQNIHFALKRAAKANKPEANTMSLADTIDLLGIQAVLKRYPGQMSGGERQRVAIARALLAKPKLLLMDEPLASLDLARKQEILPYLEQLKRELDLPIIYVSHSLDEVSRLADFLVVLNNGKVTAQGSLMDMQSSLDFPIKSGEDTGVVLEGRITERDTQWHLAKISLSSGDLWFRDYGLAEGEMVRIRVLARDISLSLDQQRNSSISNSFSAVVVDFRMDDHEGLVLVQLKSKEDIFIARITARSAHQLKITPGKKVWLAIKSVAIVQ